MYSDFLEIFKKLAKALDLSARPETLSITTSLSFLLAPRKSYSCQKKHCHFLLRLLIIFYPLKITYFVHGLWIIKFNFTWKTRFYLNLSFSIKFYTLNPNASFMLLKKLLRSGFWAKVVFLQSILPTTEIFPLKLAL